MANKNANKTKKRQVHRRKDPRKPYFTLLKLELIVAAALGLLLLFLNIYTGRVPEDKICDNVYIGSINVSGMTKEEAKAALTEQMSADQALTVTFHVEGGDAESVAEELEALTSPAEDDETTDEASDAAENGTADADDGTETENTDDASAAAEDDSEAESSSDADEADTDGEADVDAEEAEEEPVVYVSAVASGDEVKVILEALSFTFEDLDKTVDAAYDYGRTGTLWERMQRLRALKKEPHTVEAGYTVDDAALNGILSGYCDTIAPHAQDAKVSRDEDGTFVITDEVVGKKVDTEASKETFFTELNGNWGHQNLTCEVCLVEEQPKVFASDFDGFEDCLGSYSTNAGSGDRWYNLKAGMEHINGTVLQPGEEFSVHDATAPYDEEHGYRQAGSYENGQVVQTYGGGICQVSSTLYNAVLYAELEVVQRSPHSMKVAYVDPSRDAAIAGDSKDFVFKNNYDSPIFIYGEIDDDNQLTFAIFGKETRAENRTIDFTTETISTTDPGVTYKCNSELYLGGMQTVTTAHQGMEVILYKHIYIDGEETEKVQENYSLYKCIDRVIEVGTKTDNATKAAAVKAAVATQDLAKIRAAIGS